MVDNLVSEENLLIMDVAQSRKKEGKTVNLIDTTDSSGGAGIGMDGGGMLMDALSLGEIALSADSPTTLMDYNSCN